MLRFGRVDTLVNNAGVSVSRPFTDLSAEDLAHVTGVNIAGFFYITQNAVAEMLKQRRGHIVNITAAIADQPIAGRPNALAALTKGGLAAVTRSLATEYAGSGIRVNAVSPGVVKTPMHRPENYDKLAKVAPMGRMAEIKDVVDAVLYLEGACFVTGNILHVDGGQSAGR